MIDVAVQVLLAILLIKLIGSNTRIILNIVPEFDGLILNQLNSRISANAYIQYLGFED